MNDYVVIHMSFFGTCVYRGRAAGPQHAVFALVEPQTVAIMVEDGGRDTFIVRTERDEDHGCDEWEVEVFEDRGSVMASAKESKRVWVKHCAGCCKPLLDKGNDIWESEERLLGGVASAGWKETSGKHYCPACHGKEAGRT